MSDNINKLDVLVFGPHPDDAEIGTGGLLLKLASLGYSCGIIDLTRGEMASHGTIEERAKEAACAAGVLKLKARENLGFPDLKIEDNHENRIKIASVIRKYQPNMIFAPYYEAHPPGRGLGHTDHYHSGILVCNGNNYAHLPKIDTGQPPWFVSQLFFYFFPRDIQPTFVVDVSEFYNEWLDSIFCHKSQFLTDDPGHNAGVKHYFRSLSMNWGGLIGVPYGQAFYSPTPLRIDDPLTLAAGKHFWSNDPEQKYRKGTDK